MEELNTIQKIAVIALPVMFAIIVHEVAHGWVADKLGDHTARTMGRLTLNPLSHIDLFGTIIMPLFFFFFAKGMIFGYAKPVPINPNNFKNPKRDMALASLAGPGVNMVMALSCSFLLRVVMQSLENVAPRQAWEWMALPLEYMLNTGVIINVILAVLNIIPIPPLDGSRVVYWILPGKYAAVYYRLEPFGMVVLLMLFAFGALGKIIGPIIGPILTLLLGENIL